MPSALGQVNLESVNNTLGDFLPPFDNITALALKGIIPLNEYYNDLSTTSEFSKFNSASKEAAQSYNENRNSIENETNLSADQKKLLDRRSSEISSFGNVPFDAAKDFLKILINIDDSEILKRISEILNINSLSNPNIVKNIDEILNIEDLNKAAYMASAVNAIIKKYLKYIEAANKTTKSSRKENSEDFELSSIVNFITSMLSVQTPEIQGNNGNPPIPKNLGIGKKEPKKDVNGPPHYPQYDNPPENGKQATELLIRKSLSQYSGMSGMMKQFTGREIPASIRAKNPTEKRLKAEDHVYFGAEKTPMAKTDLDYIYPKPIGVYRKASNGTGAQGFEFSNSSEFSRIKGDDLVSQFSGIPKNSGFSSLTNKLTEITDIFSQVVGMTNMTEELDLRRSDTAIPIMIGLSVLNSVPELKKSPFPDKTFTEGWSLSNSVMNFIQKNDSQFFSTYRSLV